MDNFSDDDSRDIAKELGAEVRLFGIRDQLADKEYLKVKNHIWKGSKADYVIIVDSDEILYHPQLQEVLQKSLSNGVTIFKTRGWNVYSNDFPRETYLEIQTGFEDQNYAKTVIFSPKLEQINYGYGCHESRPYGELKWSEDVLTVLHYHCIGGIDRMIKRHNLYKKRLSPLNRELKLGHHYLQDDNRKRREWEESMIRSKEFSQAGFYS